MIHTIKKIAAHKHTKTVASLIVVAFFFGYFANYKPSFANETAIYTNYISDIHIESTNTVDNAVATSSEYIVLSYKLHRAGSLSYQAVDILGKKAEVRCEEERIKKDFILNCRAVAQTSAEELSASGEYIVPLKLDLVYSNKGKENITFEIVRTTDDSFVSIDREEAIIVGIASSTEEIK